MAWSAKTSRDYQHRQWALAVKERDGYQCQRCGYQGTPGRRDVEADHIANVAAGGQRHDTGNGETLCVPCHKQKTQAESRASRRTNKRSTEQHPGLI